MAETIQGLRGIITPAITVFDENGKIDYEGNKIHIENLICNGVNGILFLGSIGEFFTMTINERKEYIKFVVEIVNKRVPVLIGTGGTNVDEVIETTKYAEEEGVDAAVIISPYYFKLNGDSIYKYYADIARNVNLSIFIYNFPDRTTVDLTPELVVKLATDFENIVGIKDTVDNISHTRKLIRATKTLGREFAVFSGFDEYFVPNMMAGGNGVIGGLSNIHPKLFRNIFEAYESNNLKVLEKLQKDLNILMNIYDVSEPFIGAIKGGTKIVLHGQIDDCCRKPINKLEEEKYEKICELLNEIGNKVK